MGRRINKKRVISNDRVGKKRAQKNKIVIAVEGKNKTEKIYFNNFDDGKKSYSITIAKGNDTDPLKLVKGLDKEIKKLGLDLTSGDKAYCVFDIDIDINKNKIINEAIEYAKQVGIEVITSTPCIELWFLLHFDYTTKYLSNEKVIKRLKVYDKKYEKNYNIYPNIKDNVKTAIERAKKLEKYQLSNNRKIGTTYANPNTEMYKIVEYLIDNENSKD